MSRRWNHFRAALLAAKPEAKPVTACYCGALGSHSPSPKCASKPEAKTQPGPQGRTCCDTEFGELNHRDNCIVQANKNPAPAASPPAWLPLGQHPAGTCVSGCSNGWTLYPNTGDNFCTPYCRDRAKAVPRDAAKAEYTKPTPENYVVEAYGGGGQPGVPDGWKLKYPWHLAHPEDESECTFGLTEMNAGCTMRQAYCNLQGDSTCLAHAVEMGAIVPAEPSRPVTGEAPCQHCGRPWRNGDHFCLPVYAVAPPAPGNHPERLACDCHGSDMLSEDCPVHRPGKPDEAPLSVTCPACGGDSPWCIDRFHKPGRIVEDGQSGYGTVVASLPQLGKGTRDEWEAIAMSADEEIHCLRSKLQEAENRLQSRLNDHQKDVRDLRRQLATRDARIAQLTSQRDYLTGDCNRLQGRIAGLEAHAVEVERNAKLMECAFCRMRDIKPGNEAREHWKTCPNHPARIDKAAAVLEERERCLAWLGEWKAKAMLAATVERRIAEGAPAPTVGA